MVFTGNDGIFHAPENWSLEDDPDSFSGFFRADFSGAFVALLLSVSGSVRYIDSLAGQPGPPCKVPPWQIAGLNKGLLTIVVPLIRPAI